MKSILNSPKTRRHWLFILLPVCWLLLSSFSELRADSYDADFDRFGRRFLAHIPQANIWLTAQARQESALNPNAVSHAGARGLMQIMPRTEVEIQNQLGLRCSAFNARCSIMMGSFYDSRMYRVWDRRERTVNEIIPLMFASYNTGVGNVLKAQRLCFDGRLFEHIEPCLPAETRDYVPRIRNMYLDMNADIFSDINDIVAG